MMEQFKLKTNQIGNIGIILAIIILVGVVTTGTWVYFNQSSILNRLNSANQKPSNSQDDINISPLNIDSLSQEQIEEQNIAYSAALKSKKTLPDGSTLYTLKSPLIDRDNLIVFKNSQRVFMRLVVINPKAESPKISAYIAKYSPPTTQITGSKFYGPETYVGINSDKGYALVGNKFTDEIFEVYTFVPTTESEFLQKWGEDYSPNP